MIRELREGDTGGVARLIREIVPNWVTSEQGILHRLRASPERMQRRDWVAEAGGEVVGWSSCGLAVGAARSDVAWLGVMVARAWRGRGIGSALYEPVERHLESLGARRLLAEADNQPPSQRFAEKRGFRHTMTRRLSRLDPRSVDDGALPALAAEKDREGFTLAPFSAFADRPELIHAVDLEASQDEPSDEPTVDLPFDEWLARSWEHPDLSMDGSFAVVHDGRPVAIAELIVDLEGQRAANGFTGTLRAYRNRRAAHLAKLATIGWAVERGITSIVTENDETNAPMLALNVALGYVPVAAGLAYVREPA